MFGHCWAVRVEMGHSRARGQWGETLDNFSSADGINQITR
jgi:hypothetical protein